MINRTKYYDLTAKLQAISDKTGVYLTDENVDAENVPMKDDGSEEFYNEMFWAACNAAGFRAEEAGLDINKLLGYIIY